MATERDENVDYKCLRFLKTQAAKEGVANIFELYRVQTQITS